VRFLLYQSQSLCLTQHEGTLGTEGGEVIIAGAAPGIIVVVVSEVRAAVGVAILLKSLIGLRFLGKSAPLSFFWHAGSVLTYCSLSAGPRSQ
jgi:hypothetical protein